VRVTVLERNDYVGGLCRTVHDGGYKFDLGGHRWFTKNEHLNRWFRRLMEGELVRVQRISRIYHDGKYYMYPVEPGDVIRQAGLATILKAGLTFFAAAVRYGVLDRPIRNMKDAYTAQFGSQLYEMFFRRYTEKVWGRPCEQLSSDWVAQRSRGLSIWTVVQEALSARQSKVTSLIEEFMYPRDGYMRIPERMAEAIERDGNEVVRRASVREVIHRGAGEIDVVYETPQGSRTVRATDVVSTIPLGRLAQIVTPAPHEAVIDAARKLVFRDLITVNLKLARRQVTRDTWLYVQDESILFGRLHEPKNWSPAMVPDDEHTSLVLECFCSAGDAIWSLSDDQVAQRCIDDLVGKLRFIAPEDVEGWNVVRTRQAYPVYDLDYGPRVELIKDFLGTLPGVHIVGRGGTFRYNNADHSIEMGLLLAQRILGRHVDHMAVNTEQEYQEEIRPDGIRRDHFAIERPVSHSGSVG
jgi:protoporphyrinogen oxidase